MNIDVWFAKYEGYLFFVLAPHNEAPETYPERVVSVRDGLRIARAGYTIEQVGILPPEMIGLE